MFENFSSKAHKTLTLALREARVQGCDKVAVEHLIYALCFDSDQIGPILLLQGIDSAFVASTFFKPHAEGDSLRPAASTETEPVIGADTKAARSGLTPTFRPDVLQILEYASDFASSRKHASVQNSHLLKALLACSKTSRGCQVFESLQADLVMLERRADMQLRLLTRGPQAARDKNAPDIENLARADILAVDEDSNQLTIDFSYDSSDSESPVGKRNFFTSDSILLIASAREYADEMLHPGVGAAHLLTAMLSSQLPVGAYVSRLLHNQGLRDRIAQSVDYGSERHSSESFFSDTVVQALNEAWKIARQAGMDKLSPELILTGILTEAHTIQFFIESDYFSVDMIRRDLTAEISRSTKSFPVELKPPPPMLRPVWVTDNETPLSEDKDYILATTRVARVL